MSTSIDHAGVITISDHITSHVKISWSNHVLTTRLSSRLRIQLGDDAVTIQSPQEFRPILEHGHFIPYNHHYRQLIYLALKLARVHISTGEHADDLGYKLTCVY